MSSLYLRCPEPTLEQLIDMVDMDLTQHIMLHDLSEEDKERLETSLRELSDVTTQIMEKYYFS